MFNKFTAVDWKTVAVMQVSAAVRSGAVLRMAKEQLLSAVYYCYCPQHLMSHLHRQSHICSMQGQFQNYQINNKSKCKLQVL